MLCVPGLAFAPRPLSPWRLQHVRHLSTPEADITKVRDAFEKVKAAAQLFASGSEAAQSAASIVEKLETASFDSWQSNDLELIDSCLVDENSEACSAFGQAMIDLREVWDASPGNA